MPSDDDRPAEPPPYLFRKPHPNEGRLLGLALMGTVGGLILAAMASEAFGRGTAVPTLLTAGCVGVWAWGLTYAIRSAAFR